MKLRCAEDIIQNLNVLDEDEITCLIRDMEIKIFKQNPGITLGRLNKLILLDINSAFKFCESRVEQEAKKKLEENDFEYTNNIKYIKDIYENRKKEIEKEYELMILPFVELRKNKDIEIKEQREKVLNASEKKRIKVLEIIRIISRLKSPYCKGCDRSKTCNTKNECEKKSSKRDDIKGNVTTVIV